MTDIWANSGSLSDIQAAVDIASSGAIVHIPSGIFDAVINPSKIGINNRPVGVNVPGGVSVIGQGKEITILRIHSEPPYASTMFIVDGRNGLRTRVSGISFEGFVDTTEDTSPSAVEVAGATDYRVDHCRFLDWTGSGIALTNHYIITPGVYGVNRGVIDHCDFDAPYKRTDGSDATSDTAIWAYGIHIRGTYSNWPDLELVLGKYDGVENIVYIEDCTFNRLRHAVVANAGGFYVLRHSTMMGGIPRNFHQVDIHGASGAQPAVGGRGFEIYENLIVGGPFPQDMGGGWRSQGMVPRGGGGVIFNNRMIDLKFGIRFTNDPGVYELTRLKDMYLWNNTVERQVMPPEFTTTLFTNVRPTEIVENVDFFQFERLGYAPLPYPHRLVSEAIFHTLTVNANIDGNLINGIPFKIRSR